MGGTPKRQSLQEKDQVLRVPSTKTTHWTLQTEERGCTREAHLSALNAPLWALEPFSNHWDSFFLLGQRVARVRYVMTLHLQDNS